jgi:ribosomal protein L7/L12
MKFITAEQLYDKLKEKRVLQLFDLVKVIEEEFEVSVRVEGNELDDLDVKALAEDPDVIRQIRASREDRKAGRTYTGEEGLEFLRQQIREFEREGQSNL